MLIVHTRLNQTSQHERNRCTRKAHLDLLQELRQTVDAGRKRGEGLELVDDQGQVGQDVVEGGVALGDHAQLHLPLRVVMLLDVCYGNVDLRGYCHETGLCACVSV